MSHPDSTCWTVIRVSKRCSGRTAARLGSGYARNPGSSIEVKDGTAVMPLSDSTCFGHNFTFRRDRPVHSLCCLDRACRDDDEKRISRFLRIWRCQRVFDLRIIK